MPTFIRLRAAAFARRWAIGCLVILCCLGLGAAWAARQTPSYQASATVGVPAETATAELIALIEEEAVLLATPAVRSEIEDQVAGPSARAIDAALRPQLSTSGTGLTFTTRAPDPSVAQLISQSYADVYLEQRLERNPAPAPELQLLTAAEFPLSPTSPNMWRIALVSGAIGVLSAVAATSLLDRRKADTTAHRGIDPRVATAQSADVKLASGWLSEPAMRSAQDQEPVAPDRLHVEPVTDTARVAETEPALEQVPRIPNDVLARARDGKIES